MHDLKIPDQLTGGAAQRNDRVCVGIAALPLAAVIVGAGTAGGYENQVAGDID
jgi:hypothetical protein